MSNDDTVEGYPGGNWPSKTGEPSGGGRGNAPSEADWGWDDDDGGDVDILGAMHRNRLQTQLSLQQLPSPPRKAKTWQIEGEIEFLTTTTARDREKLKLKANDTIYHLDKRLLPALGRRGEIEYLRNICPGDDVAAKVYRADNSFIYVYRVHVKNWDLEIWRDRAKGGGLLGDAFRLNKQAYEAYQGWINTERTVRRGSLLSSERCPPEEIAKLRQTRPSDLSDDAEPLFQGQPEMIDAVAYLFDEHRAKEVQSYLLMRYGNYWQQYSPESTRISEMIEDVKRNVKARPIHDP